MPVLCKDDKNVVNRNEEACSEPFQIYEDKKDKQPNSFTSFPIYHDENKQSMDIAHGINEEEGCSAGFTIFSDEKQELPSINVKIPTDSKPFTIYNDENESYDIKRKVAKVTPLGSFKNVLKEKDNPILAPEINEETHPKNFSEDKENVTPSDYQAYKEKRPIAGILKPSLTVPFLPLEEQKEMEEAKNYDDENEVNFFYFNC